MTYKYLVRTGKHYMEYSGHGIYARVCNDGSCLVTSSASTLLDLPPRTSLVEAAAQLDSVLPQYFQYELDWSFLLGAPGLSPYPLRAKMLVGYLQRAEHNTSSWGLAMDILDFLSNKNLLSDGAPHEGQ
jgi:hypothetical protein